MFPIFSSVLFLFCSVSRTLMFPAIKLTFYAYAVRMWWLKGYASYRTAVYHIHIYFRNADKSFWYKNRSFFIYIISCRDSKILLHVYAWYNVSLSCEKHDLEYSSSRTIVLQNLLILALFAISHGSRGDTSQIWSFSSFVKCHEDQTRKVIDKVDIWRNGRPYAKRKRSWTDSWASRTLACVYYIYTR